MSHTINTKFGHADYAFVSNALIDNNVVGVIKNYDGTFCVKEYCDEYFSVRLTRDQLLAWAEELKELANS